VELIQRHGSAPVVDVTGALSGVSFAVAPGEIFGLYGPRGAGKSTLLNLLARDPGNAGAAQIRVRGQVVISRGSDADPLAAIVRACDRGADLLMLDEPLLAQPTSQHAHFWAALDHARAGCGLCVLLTTTIAHEAERCDRVALLHRGRLLAIGRPSCLAANLDHDLIEARSDHPAALAAILAQHHDLTSTPMAKGLSLRVPRDSPLIPQLLTDPRLPAHEIVVRRPGLDDVFHALTGRGLPRLVPRR
jgi:ABC-type multidrug transport system ATPase subunit